jgi:hypothetical protein
VDFRLIYEDASVFHMLLSLPVSFAKSHSDPCIKVMNVHQPLTVHRVPHVCHSKELSHVTCSGFGGHAVGPM